MLIKYSKSFKKNYQKRIGSNKSLARKFRERVFLFSENPNHPLLRDHSLSGAKSSLRAFSVTGDIRVIYKETNYGVVLFDIGTHNQVY